MFQDFPLISWWFCLGHVDELQLGQLEVKGAQDFTARLAVTRCCVCLEKGLVRTAFFRQWCQVWPFSDDRCDSCGRTHQKRNWTIWRLTNSTPLGNDYWLLVHPGASWCFWWWLDHHDFFVISHNSWHHHSPLYTIMYPHLESHICCKVALPWWPFAMIPCITGFWQFCFVGIWISLGHCVFFFFPTRFCIMFFSLEFH